MTDIASLAVSLDLDTNRFTYGLNQAGTGLRQLEGWVDRTGSATIRTERNIQQLSEQLRQLRSLAASFAGLTLFKKGFGDLLEAQRSFQQIHFGLQGALGSAQAATKAFAYLSETSQRLGLNLQSAASEFTKLTASATAMGVPMAQQKQLFEGLARSATVMHLSADQVKFATMALSQMFGKGKIQAEELRRQLGEHIPGVVPRFQKAVMEAVKGTELAGNSFDDLLRKGALVTDRFLPQLIQALEETGRGAEVAAQGLQANLNRLSNAWFQWRKEATDGFFNEAVITSAKLLAENFKLVADSIVAIGVAYAGIKTSKFLGNAIGAGVEKVSDIKASAQATRELLSAQKERAAQNLRIAQAELQQAEATKKGLIAAQNSAANMKRVADATRAQADVAVETARRQIQEYERLIEKTRRGKQKGARQVIEETSLHLEKAKNDLARAETRYAAAVASSNQAMTAQASISRTLTKHQLELAAAENSVAMARARLEQLERRTAALTFFNRLRVGIVNAGRAALAFVGGPIGLLITGLTAVGMAYANMKRKAEEASSAFKQQKTEIENLAITLQDMNTAREGTFSLGDRLQAWGDSLETIRQAEQKLRELEARRKQLFFVVGDDFTDEPPPELKWWERFLRGPELVGNHSHWAQELRQINQQIRELERPAAQAREEFTQLERVIEASIRPSLFQQMKTAAEKLDDITFAKLRAQLTPLENQLIRIRTAFDEILSKRKDDAWEDELEWIRASQGELAAYIAQRNKEIEDAGGLQNMLPSQLADYHADIERKKLHIERMERHKKEKEAQREAESAAKKAAEERARTVESIREAIRRQTEVNQEYLDSGEKITSTERLLIRLEGQLEKIKGGLTQATYDQLRADMEALRVQGEKVAQTEREREATESLVRLKEELANLTEMASQANEDELLNLGRGSLDAERARRLIALRRDYNRQYERINKDNKADREKELGELRVWYENRLRMEDEFQAQMDAARSNWRLGVAKAWADFRDTSFNVAESIASHTQSVFSNFVNTLNEALFTGKLAFTDFVNHALKEISRILLSKALAQLVDVMMGVFGFGLGNKATRMSGGPTYSSATWAANGAVVGPDGPMPLHKYATGGIARSPQLAIFGEGRLPEAYVPLPDGRTIPVTLKGNIGAGDVINKNNISIVLADGERRQADSRGTREAQQLGQVIEGAVKDVLVREMRQGGLLWRMRNGA